MAGNLVKWWKHKILGGYKQFSVQECTTDSEELMYHQVRASSSCSAPPDLLLVSDRENNIPLRSPVVNIIGNNTSATAPATLTTTSPSSGINACPITSATNNNQRHQQHHHHNHQKLLQQQQNNHHHHVTTQQLSLAYNGTKDVNGQKHQKQNISGIGSKHGQQQPPQQQDLQQQSQEIEGQQVEAQTTTTNHSSARHAHQTNHHQQQQQQQQQQRNEEHIRLEEFTCDVSVEGGKSSQPLQFSFTFYDLDGHHGKITKDDIVGIVYTIYESIGKSVVVPHSGSKTINVRLTVSPEGKSKAAKSKKATAVGLDNSQTTSQKASAVTSSATRRLHRYRPRKLIKSDDEDDDSNSDKERDTNLTATNLTNGLAQKSSSKSHKFNKLKQEQQCCTQQQVQIVADLQNSPIESIYDNIKPATTPETCRECMAAVDETRNAAISPTTAAVTAAATQFHNNKSITNEAYMKHVASTRIKMLRKSRKQKHQDCIETRQRSLSVGNETCWKNRHLQKQPTQQQLQWHAEQQLQNTVDTVDGVQLRNPLKASKASMSQKRNSAECWKTALNRNDLISIIRESMEKNRLCFQLNGKPQANVSPIRHSQQQQQSHHQQHLLQHHKHSQQRQRSNTVSKIPTLIANHHSVSPQSQHYAHQRSSSCTNSNNNNISNDTSQLHEHQHHSNTSSNSIYHPQPHIPIYHQQMPINPAVIAAQNALSTNNAVGGSLAGGHHSKMNLCGYDSFLHATICGGGLSHSPPPPTTTSAQSPVQQQSSASAIVGIQGNAHYSHHQQIATVQPIMSSTSPNLPNTPKHLGLAAVTSNQIKTSKILRSGSYAQNQQQQQSLSAANSASPQYHGYQRLPSTSKHNLAALHLVSPTMEKPQLDQLDKWRRDQVKNYDQLLYAKLSEKLQQTNLVAPSRETRENVQRRKHHRMLRQRRSNTAIIQEANNISLPTVLTNKLCIRDDNDYATMIPINGDPVECENLIGQTSDEESHHSQHEMLTNSKEVLRDPLESKLQARHVVEGTLVDLGEVNHESQLPNPGAIKHSPLNVDTLLSVEAEDDQDLHLEIDEDLEEDLDDELEEIVGVTESGRQSADSNDTNIGSACGGAASATIANTNGANTSTTSSSLIHRYVHEHIHHHYHHFEEKEE